MSAALHLRRRRKQPKQGRPLRRKYEVLTLRASNVAYLGMKAVPHLLRSADGTDIDAIAEHRIPPRNLKRVLRDLRGPGRWQAFL